MQKPIKELNQSVINFFDKLIERLFLRLVDKKTGKIKRNNQNTKPLHEFINSLEKALSDKIVQIPKT